MGGGVMGDLENNMDNSRTTLILTRANRRARSHCCRGRVRPRRLGLSKVVDVVSNSNDMLGTTIGSKSNGKYSAAVLSAFGENLANDSTDSQYFTGKPFVEGLGHAFLMRNYRAGLAKWQSADPMGYPDGWNQLAYCNNGVTGAVDLWGCKWVDVRTWNNSLSDGEWEELCRTAKSDKEILATLFRYGELGWTKPIARKGAEQLIVGPVTTQYENITDLTWYKDITISYVYNRVDTLEVTVTTKELKDDPSLLNAFVQLAGTLGSKLKNPYGQLIGIVADAFSVAQAFDEINECINQYGKDTVWTIDLGTGTYTKTRQSSVGFFRVNE